MSVFWRQSFGSAPVDEIALDTRARQELSGRSFSCDEEALAYCDSLDDNLASAVFYRYLTNIRHREFINAIDNLPATPINAGRRIKLLVVPGFFYKEHPDIGSGGDMLFPLGSSFGFEVDRAPLKSLGTVSENAALLGDCLRAEPHANVWLVSFSKAAAEIRLLMQQMGRDFPSNVRGWISVSGSIGGTPLATRRFRTRLHRALNTLFFPLLGTSARAIEELRDDHPFWQQALVLPNDMELIHVLGVPLMSHVQPVLMNSYRQMRPLGLNDGMGMFRPVLACPGHVYPVWGADHFLRTPALSPLLYRLLRYVANTGE